MTAVRYAVARPAAPTLEALGSEDPDRLRSARLAAAVPLALTLGVQAVFFLQYWLPETSHFPTRHWWLTQLAPLASPGLTSAGTRQVIAQDGSWGLAAVVLLAASWGVFGLCRSARLWLGPVLLAVPFGIGLVTAIIVVTVLAATGNLGRSALAVLVLIAWLVAAGYATIGKIFNAPLDLPVKRVRDGLPLLVLYAAVGPVPTAVGRWLFGGDLRQVAANLQQNEVAFRLGALWTPSTLLFYLCGLAVGVAVWIAYHCWPVRQASIRPVVALVVTVLLIGLLGWPTAISAGHRAETLAAVSPARNGHFACGAWMLQPPADQPAGPEETAVISGFTCRTLTTYVGYRQMVSHTLPTGLDPVEARVPNGRTITTTPVAAQYGPVIVIAGTDRLSGEADQLFAVAVYEQKLLWSWRCGEDRSRPMELRFARVPGGDDPAAGHVTRGEKRATIVVRCEDRTVRFDPITGRR